MLFIQCLHFVNLGMLYDIWENAHGWYTISLLHYMEDTYHIGFKYLGILGEIPPQILWGSHVSWKEVSAEAKMEGRLFSLIEITSSTTTLQTPQG